MAVTLQSLGKRFDDILVFRDLSLSIEDSQVTAILGPSGCGKTTLLNIIAGIQSADEGSISGVDDRKISYLFQEPRLLPWKTVHGNIDLVLLDLFEREERNARIEDILTLVGLREFADCYPRDLSGGMKQRLAMARAFAYPAEIILMDEPFQALDLKLKISLAKSFNTVWQKMGRTILFVTHDIHEALMLGDTITVLSRRPAKVLESIRNRVPRQDRSLRHEEILGIEKKLYAHLR